MRVLKLSSDLKRWLKNGLHRRTLDYSSGVSSSLLLLRFTIPVSLYRWVWGTYGMVTDKRKHKRSGNATKTPLYPTEITPNILDLNPDLRSDKLSTSPLSYRTALKRFQQRHSHFGKERELYLACMSGYSPPLGCHVLLCQQSTVKSSHFQRSLPTSGTLYPIICSFLVYFL